MRMAGFGFNTAVDDMKQGKYVFLSQIQVSQLSMDAGSGCPLVALPLRGVGT